MTPAPHPRFIIYQGEIDILREKVELLRDLYPASAEAIEKICARIENRASHSSAVSAAKAMPSNAPASDEALRTEKVLDRLDELLDKYKEEHNINPNPLIRVGTVKRMITVRREELRAQAKEREQG